MNSRSCRWLVWALLITASGAQAQRSAPTTKDSIGGPQGSAQAASQAQKSNAQKLLMDSIEKLDVAGVRAALDKGANPNGVYGSCNSEQGFSVIGQVAMAVPYENVEGAEKRGVEILKMLFKAGAKLQPCDQGILFAPVVNGSALFTEAL